MAVSAVKMIRCLFKQRRTLKVCTVLGSCLLVAPMTVDYVWGNLSIYVLSYIRTYSPSVSGDEATWVASLYLMMQGISVIPAAYLIEFVGNRISALIGIIFLNIGGFASYFAIDRSLLLLDLTHGALSGAGSGVLFSSGTEYIMQWADEGQTGTLMAVMYSSCCAMAIVVNQFITAYVNPDNKDPDDLSGQYTYFKQKDVVEKVPSVFVILSTCYLTLQLIGFFLLRDNRPTLPLHKEKNEKTSGYESIKDNSLNEEDTPTKTNPLSPSSEDAFEKTSIVSENKPGYESTQKNGIPSKEYDSQLSRASSSSSSSSSESLNDVPPRQLMRTPSFYLLWIAYFTNEVTFIVMSVNYKAYGLLWISDDRFLTSVGTVVAVILVVSNLLAGVAVDKLGHKPALMFYYGTLTVCGAFFYLMPQWNKWLYSLLVIFAVSLSGSGFLLHSVAVAKLYGRKHVVHNFGILNSAGIVVNLGAPSVIKALMDFHGWMAVFYTSATLSAIAFILVAIGIPRR